MKLTKLSIILSISILVAATTIAIICNIATTDNKEPINIVYETEVYQPEVTLKPTEKETSQSDVATTKIKETTTKTTTQVNTTKQTTTKKIVKEAMDREATGVVISHNHPGGKLIASSDDAIMTRNIATALNLLGIELIDHILVAENRYTSILHSGYGL